MTDNDQVNHPKHYGGENAIYETIKVLEAWLTPVEFVGFLRGNVIKYLTRAGKKGGDEQHDKDLAKARWYMDYEIDFHKRRDENNVGELRAAKIGYAMCREKGSNILISSSVDDEED